MLALARCGAGVTCNEFADSSWHSTTLSVEPGPMAVANPLSSLRTVLQQPSSSGYRSRSHENTEQPESLPAQWAQTLEPVQLETFISVPVKNCQKKFVANSKKLSSVQRPLGSSGQTLGTGGWGVRILNIATKSNVLRSSDQVVLMWPMRGFHDQQPSFARNSSPSANQAERQSSAQTALLCWFLQGASST